jgi:hypothetical protein
MTYFESGLQSKKPIFSVTSKDMTGIFNFFNSNAQRNRKQKRGSALRGYEVTLFKALFKEISLSTSKRLELADVTEDVLQNVKRTSSFFKNAKVRVFLAR